MVGLFTHMAERKLHFDACAYRCKLELTVNGFVLWVEASFKEGYSG